MRVFLGFSPARRLFALLGGGHSPPDTNPDNANNLLVGAVALGIVI